MVHVLCVRYVYAIVEVSWLSYINAYEIQLLYVTVSAKLSMLACKFWPIFQSLKSLNSVTAQWNATKLCT